jgi:hypothetical protein
MIVAAAATDAIAPLAFARNLRRLVITLVSFTWSGVSYNTAAIHTAAAIPRHREPRTSYRNGRSRSKLAKRLDAADHGQLDVHQDNRRMSLASQPHTFLAGFSLDGLVKGVSHELQFLGLFSTIRMSCSLATMHRDRERECRALAYLALHPDSSTVEFDELPTEGQPKARPLSLLVRGPHLAELVEYRVLVLRSNSDTRVAD